MAEDDDVLGEKELTCDDASLEGVDSAGELEDTEQVPVSVDETQDIEETKSSIEEIGGMNTGGLLAPVLGAGIDCLAGY